MVGAVLASLLLLAGAWYINRRSALVPNRLQSLLELPVEWVAGIVEGSSSRWRGYVALVIGLFLMILVANWLGLLPGVGTIGIEHVEEGHEVLVPFVRPAGGRPQLHARPGPHHVRRVRLVGRPAARPGRLPEGAGRRAALHGAAHVPDPPHQRAEPPREPVDATLRQRVRRRGADRHHAGADHGRAVRAAARVLRPGRLPRPRAALRSRAGAGLRTAHDDLHHDGHRGAAG